MKNMARFRTKQENPQFWFTFKTVLWSTWFLLNSGWRPGGHTETDYSSGPLGKVSPPQTDAGRSCRQAVRLYGSLVPFRQAISYTKRFSNPTPFVKWKNQTSLSCEIMVKNWLELCEEIKDWKGCQGFVTGYRAGKDRRFSPCMVTTDTGKVFQC